MKYECSFRFDGDDRSDALAARIVAALEVEEMDFDPASVIVTYGKRSPFVNDPVPS